jgi:hypothetical protein
MYISSGNNISSFVTCKAGLIQTETAWV